MARRRSWLSRRAWIANRLSRLEAFEHRFHLFVNQVDGLERSNHHPEFSDHTIAIAGDDVDTVDVFAVHRGFELEHGVGSAQDLFGVAEATSSVRHRFIRLGLVAAAEGAASRREVKLRYLSPLLGGEDNRRVEGDVFVEEVVEKRCIASLDVLVPASDTCMNRICH